MRAVLDEGVPRRVTTLLRSLGQDVSAFPKDWKGLTNGALLGRLRGEGFDCLLTCDRSIPYQQRMSTSGIGLVVLPAQRFEDIEPYATQIAAALASVTVGAVIVVPKKF